MLGKEQPSAEPRRFHTDIVHAGEETRNLYGSVTTPIVQTVNFYFESTAELEAFYREKHGLNDLEKERYPRFKYGRTGNPTQQTVEKKLAALEGGEAALLTSSGMSAVSTALLDLLSAGDHLVMVGDPYFHIKEFVDRYLTKWNITSTYVPMNDFTALEQAIQPNTRIVFAETPTNPHMRVMDMKKAVQLCREKGLYFIVDSTFATPYNLRPLEYGADLVIHSATKFISGHNDVIAGVLIGRASDIHRMRDSLEIMGGTIQPMMAYWVTRGLKTLGLRMERHNATALRVAQFLDAHPKVRKVYYPGLPSHPDYAIALSQMRGYGGVVTFEVDHLEQARQVVDAMRIPRLASSLGGVESLISVTAMSAMAYFFMTQEERMERAIPDGMIRFSIGIEDPDDIIADLAQALDKL
ncbi:trans-sulfuration enzyme family protein [Paenibacillus sp. UNC451MF]|uniref:trans-sulfuration enzyme family protein n=1 Tax=Paenibacillus sp. UNC451MF TaxID=1449063 RepID=UPI00068C0C9E|nr:aminotransferase class I/II-fold pyridoxal phosphate-dependent enzyme [Paenibacillus sp. UNC451MF]